jgi:predicted GIY-YIG superfamily endonuclease
LKYVYILQSFAGEHFYVGVTDDLDARLSKHNAGAATHTSKFARGVSRALSHLQMRRAFAKARM